MVWYPWLKLIHILSATLLFGTGLGTAYYMWSADRRGDVRVIAQVAAYVVRADWWFTTPAVIIQPLSGIAMALILGWPLSTPWIAVSLLLYVLIGCCWLPVVWIQIRVARIAQQCAEAGTSLPATHRRLMTWWYGLGWPAFLGVVGIFYLMVFKRLPW